MPTDTTTMPAAQQVVEAERELAEAQAALPALHAAVDVARDGLVTHRTLPFKSAKARASRSLAQGLERVFEAEALIRVARRAAAVEQASEDDARREAEKERQREAFVRSTATMARLRAALEEIRTLDRHPDLPVRRYAAWGDLIVATGRLIGSYTDWPKKTIDDEGTTR